MKRVLKKFTSFTLAASLLISVLPLHISASETAPDWGIVQRTISVNTSYQSTLNTTIIKQENSTKRQAEYVISYTPGGSIKPMVAYGNKLYGMSTINTVEKYLIAQGYPVVGGINADFFSLKTGLPLGPVITNGIIRSSDAGSSAIGFFENGSAFIGKPNMQINLTTETQTINIDHINKLRTPYGLYMLTSDFSGNTRNSTAGVDVILGSVQGDLKIGSSLTAVVEEITPYDSAIAIPEGKLILTIDDKGPSDKREQLLNLIPGETVTITVTSEDERWNNVKEAVGGGEILIQDGQIQPGLGNDVAPRTALGIKANGEILLYTVDGRQTGYSNGYSVKQLAGRLLDLGCVSAINLDGGGSTAIKSVYPGESESTLINKPSDGSLRKCANYIFLVNTAPPVGNLSNLHIYPYDLMILPGATQRFKIKATDENYYPVTPPENVNFSVTGTLNPSSSNTTIGEFDEYGTFTALSGGEGYITAEYSGATGKTRLTVLDDITNLEVYNESNPGTSLSSISISPGKTINLTADGYKGLIKAVAQDNCFKWEIIEGNIGTIDQNGTFTASNISGASGTIRVSFGSVDVKISVKVGNSPMIIEDFEDNNLVISSNTTGETTITRDSKLEYVRYDKYSGKVGYNFTKSPDTLKCLLPANIKFSGKPLYMSFWIYGDGSQHLLSVRTIKGGAATEVPVVLLNDRGWSYVSVNLEGAEQVDGFILSKNTTSDVMQGEFWIDQFAAVYDLNPDLTPPDISINTPVLNSDNTYSISATITDESVAVPSQNIRVTCDGVDISFSYNDKSGALTATLPQSDKNRVFSIHAKDILGNRIKKSINILPPDYIDQQIFTDMDSHWSRDYVNYLYNLRIINGEDTDLGKIFRPDSNITRAEFAIIMINYLGKNPSDYNDVNLPYSDLSAIPSWALPHVKAAYKLGIITGKGIGGGKIIYDPSAPLTRAEAMTIIGRTQPRGYIENLSFSDASDVPSWSEPFVRSLIGQGIVTGYPDGTVKPNNSITRGEAAKILYSLY